MLVRISLLFAALGLALATTACSSLTKPDEIQIAPEPPAAPTLRELPAAPAAPGGAQAAPHPPGSGG
ncbi:MAG: hypothetical protein QM820_48030 [Minicystis sp.]